MTGTLTLDGEGQIGIRAFQDWLRESDASKPWLLVGDLAPKQMLKQARQEGFRLMSTGSKVGSCPAEVACVVDVEHMATSGDAIAAQARFVVMPNDPHREGWAAGKPLASYFDEIPSLQRLAAEGRLLGFDLWTARQATADETSIRGDFLGEEVPLRLLALGGARFVRHLGFRGARDKITGFEAAHSILSRTTGGLAEARRALGVSYGPYGYPAPARVFVGTDDEQMIGARVLHYSIEKFSSMDVVVEPLDWRAAPIPQDPKNRSKTGFSFCRFDIPRLCNYSGRGVYVDADMQVFTDFSDLWTLPLDDADLLYALAPPSQGRTPQTSVMLMNCEALRWDMDDIVSGLDRGDYSYGQLMSELCVVPPGRAQPLLPYWWNSLELYEEGRTSLLHYTDMNRQPWVSHSNPNGHRWYRCCAEALDSGFISEQEVVKAVDLGHVSPEIFTWIGRNSPYDEVERAAKWVAPFNRYLQPKAPEGSVALTSDHRLIGWAWDPSRPEEASEVGVYDDSELVFSFTCGDFGEFLQKHGKGDGRHAFNVALPPGVLTSNVHTLSVRTLHGNVQLTGSPVEVFR